MRTGGYTLIELLVVFAVISLLIMAVPAIISAARPGAEARAAAVSLANDLRAARAAAVTDDNEGIVRFDVGAKIYVVEPGHRVHRVPALVTVEFQPSEGALDSSQAELRFFPDGSSSGGSIQLSAGGQHYRIMDHALTGRITINE